MADDVMILLDTIQLDQPSYTGKNIAAIARDASGNIWNGSAYVAYTSDAAMVAGAINPNGSAGSVTAGTKEQGDTAFFQIWGPAGIQVSGWSLVIYQIAGATMVAGDVA